MRLGQAEAYLQAKQYELAARAFAKTSSPFEEVALRFIALGEKDALKAFLIAKLMYELEQLSAAVVMIVSERHAHACTR